MIYPEELQNSFPNCQDQVTVWIPDASTQYIKVKNILRMRIPAIHRRSKQLVWLEAPATNCTEATVFRDCPDFIPYRPQVPVCRWTNMAKQGTTHILHGAVLSKKDVP